jgi:hypothetical protein
LRGKGRFIDQLAFLSVRSGTDMAGILEPLDDGGINLIAPPSHALSRIVFGNRFLCGLRQLPPQLRGLSQLNGGAGKCGWIIAHQKIFFITHWNAFAADGSANDRNALRHGGDDLHANAAANAQGTSIIPPRKVSGRSWT